jgi:hypothetical protein
MIMRTRRLFYGLLIPTLFVCFNVVSAAIFMISDIDSGSKPNNIGGDFGCWNKDEGDPTQGCAMRFNPDIKHGSSGYSLQLDYDVDSPNPAYNGFWMKLQSLDVSKYDRLIFWVKGDKAAGFSSSIKLELKNAKGEVGRYTLNDITDSWREITVPLSQFSGLTDLSSMTEFVIVFDDMTCATRKQGTIYIDDISFAN